MKDVNKMKIILAVLFLLSILVIYLTFNFIIELSSFAVALAKVFIAVFLFWLFDKYGLHEIDTVQELKKGNIAYALFVLSIAIVIASAVLGS